MKTQIRALAIAVGLLCAASGFAQTAASNAMNTATTAASTAATNAVNTAKASASAAMAAKVNPPAAAPAAAPATAAAPAATAPAKMATAGGAGKVWVNASSKTYHCEGSKFYGKTKTGEYMSEADAKSKGNHAVKGKACAK